MCIRDRLKEAEQVPDVPSEKDLEGRLDLRDEITFTIDGADAKDLDDAVHIKLLKNGNFELGVHIADCLLYTSRCVEETECGLRLLSAPCLGFSVPF